MKTLSFTPIAFAFLAFGVRAQDPGPSPTESVGCVPHGNHWDCQGPAPTATVESAPSPAVTTTSTHVDGEGDAEHSTAAGPGPSPTESVGCVPHNDHWDCEGPATAAAQTTAATATATTQDHDADQHSGSSLAPSPTESVGCKPHGDHWHCDGPATTAAQTTAAAATATTQDHDADQHSGSSLAPSPTESVGCVSHGDHWDCEGPATSTAISAGTTLSAVVNASSSASSSQTVVPFTGSASRLHIKSTVFGSIVGGLVLLYAL